MTLETSKQVALSKAHEDPKVYYTHEGKARRDREIAEEIRPRILNGLRWGYDGSSLLYAGSFIGGAISNNEWMLIPSVVLFGGSFVGDLITRVILNKDYPRYED